MATTKAGPVSAERLKSFVTRVEKLDEERTAINGDIKDVLSEAKGVGYDVPTIRRLITYRKLDAADRAERDSLDAVYRHALGMAIDAVTNGDMSLREAAKAHGVSKSSIHRGLAVPEVSREMVADDLGEIGPEEIKAKTPPASFMPSSEAWQEITSVREAHHAAIEAAREARRQQRQREREHTSSLSAITADDMPALPPFLRRVA